MNIDDVLGIIIYEDGIPHSFGKRKNDITANLTNENFHDKAFVSDVLNTQWFKSTNYQYDTNNNFFYNSTDMCKNGFCIIINSCSKLVDGTEYNLFTIQVKENMTDNIKSYLESIYQSFNSLINDKESLFYGYIYDEEGNEIAMEFSIDSFYDKLNLDKSIKKVI